MHGRCSTCLVIVNALGDIFDPQTHNIISEARRSQKRQPQTNTNIVGNTTITVIATNATLTKAETNKVAQMAHSGIAYAIQPAHTMFDGDAIFALATYPAMSDIRHDSSIAAPTGQHDRIRRRKHISQSHC